MTDFNGFLASGIKLSDTDIPRIGHRIGIGEDLVHAVIETETAGRWTDTKGRLPMLFEPHVIYRNCTGPLRAKFVKAGLAYAKWGEKPYPKDSYPRLLKAIAIDETVALKGCSWGAPQILGEGYALADFDTVQEMLEHMLESEANQLDAMISFIIGKGLDDELQRLQAKIDAGKTITADDCRPFVSGYNGKGYEKNQYHTKLAAHIAKWRKIPDTPWSPDDVQTDLTDGKVHAELKSIQQSLDEIGYPEVGEIDGRWGSRTRGTILTFRADNGLPAVESNQDLVDANFLTTLALRPQRKINPARANATVADLRKEEGAEDIRQNDQNKVLGIVTAAGGTLVAADKATSALEQYSDIAGRVAGVLNPIQSIIMDNLWIILIGIGGFVIWKSNILQRIRLEKHQTGKDVSA